jgi:hypothetical protein
MYCNRTAICLAQGPLRVAFWGFNNPNSERTSRLSESRCCGRPAHITGPLLYFPITEVGAQTAPPPMAPRPPPLQVRERLCASYLPAQGSVGRRGSAFGPRTALDGRPTALIEAGADAGDS